MFLHQADSTARCYILGLGLPPLQVSWCFLATRYIDELRCLGEERQYDDLGDPICYPFGMVCETNDPTLTARIGRMTEGENAKQGVWNIVSFVHQLSPTATMLAYPGDVWVRVNKDDLEHSIEGIFVRQREIWEEVPVATPLGVYEHPVLRQHNQPLVLSLGAHQVRWVLQKTHNNWARYKYYPPNVDKAMYLAPDQVTLEDALRVLHQLILVSISRVPRSNRGYSWHGIPQINASNFWRPEAHTPPPEAHTPPPEAHTPPQAPMPPPDSPLSVIGEGVPSELTPAAGAGDTAYTDVAASDSSSHWVRMEVVFVVDPVVQENRPGNRHDGPSRPCWWAKTTATVGEYRRLKAECSAGIFHVLNPQDEVAREYDNEEEIITVDMTEWVCFPAAHTAVHTNF